MALRGVLAVSIATMFGVACAGFPHLERHHRRAAASAPVSGEPAKPPPSPSPSPLTPSDEHRDHHLAHAAFACFTGGAWMEALGSIGEERTIATTHRCRMLVTDALGGKPDDAAALSTARSIDPKAVDVIAKAIGEQELSAIVRAAADAAREAAEARKLAEALRKDKSAKIDDALGKKDALAKLHAMKPRTAKVVALVLAADRVESARGLPPRAKILAAAPAFELVFGVARPSGDDWLSYVTAAAKAGGHAPSDNTEAAAFAALVTSFAEKFELLAKEAEHGEPQEVAAGYAKRLRTQLSEAAKKKQSN